MSSKHKTHKKQHFVPQCYTKPWCDPDGKQNPRIEPFVWVFDRDGANPRRKSPANLFTETDIYSIPLPDGQRDLYLEHGFQELEDKFTRVRNLTLSRRVNPSQEDVAWLLAFASTAHVRTAAFRDFQRQQWAHIRQRMEEMQAAMSATTPDQRRAFSRVESAEKGAGLGIEDVRRLETFPIQNMIGAAVRVEFPRLSQMTVAILCTDDPQGFVTTDHPCTWFDPQAYRLQPVYRGPSLSSRTIEITMPISPHQCLVITHQPIASKFYVDIQPAALQELNRRHIGHCDKSFVSNRNEINPIWFENRPLPDDAWENVRARKIASGEWPSR